MVELPAPTTSAQEFFEQWFPRAFSAAELPEEARAVAVDFGVRLEGEGGGEWLFRLNAGELRVETGSTEEAAFTLIQSVADWRGCLWEGRGGAFGRRTAALFQPGANAAGGSAGMASRPLGPAGLARLQALRGLIRMVVAGGEGGEDWRVDFKLGPGAIPPEPTTTVTLSAEDAAAMERGELDPVQAFMAGRVRVTGDMMLLMQMQSIQAQGATGAS